MRRQLLLLCILVWALGAAACSGETKDKGCRDGYLLSEDGTQCVAIALNCEEGQVGSLFTACEAEHRLCIALGADAHCGNCKDGFKEVNGECVAVVDCDGLECTGSNRVCSSAGAHEDAVCLECKDGYKEIDGVCAMPNCDENAPASMLDACREENKVCIADSTGAYCGACVSGYLMEDGDCIPLVYCQELSCAEANRTCIEATSDAHAECGGCKPGFELDGNLCRATPLANCDAAGELSILDECEAADRYCMLGDGGAYCGDCKDPKVEEPNSGICYEPGVCDPAVCADQNRVCSDSALGLCGACAEGYAEDEESGDCRTTLSCSDISCGDDEVCVPAGTNTDAFCRQDCGSSAIWNGYRCEPCPPCNGEGEVARWPWPTAAGNCICETEEGYYYSISADMGPFQCDGDSDGWTRESARIAIESNDPNVADNARCNVLAISQFELINEYAEKRVAVLESPVELYETDRNDDSFLLEAYWQADDLPVFGQNLGDNVGRNFSPAELNRLTKACHTPTVDYNDNGSADVDDYGSMDLSPAMLEEQAAFNRFSYFVELYQGWYKAPVGTSEYGSYVIVEKSRLQSPTLADEQKIALNYAPSDNTYWRQCEVRRDAEWQTADPPVGMDFAEFYQEGNGDWHGMNHHSQFKCMVVDNTEGSNAPHKASVAEVGNYGYRPNVCALSGEPVAVSNSSSVLSKVECEYRDVSTLDPGDVFFGSVPYRDHGLWVDREYERGCYNECIDILPTCPAYDINPDAVDCVYASDIFGKFVTCKAWEACDAADNTGEGDIDEGDPEFDSDTCTNTAFDGICRHGLWHCCHDDFTKQKNDNDVDYELECVGVEERGGDFHSDSQWTCVPNVLPDDEAETCNTLDDDCDGDVDENAAGEVLNKGYGSCTLENNKGKCRIGILRCHNGEYECDQIHNLDYNDNETCDPLGDGDTDEDEDCDGEVNEPTLNSDGSCPPPWRWYYRDYDGDGKGDKSSAAKCLCQAGQVEYYTATSQTDCCDRDNRVPSWDHRTYVNKCGDFNWNCVNGVEKYYSSKVGTSDGCKYRILSASCEGGSDGWSGSDPGCGNEGGWYGVCKWQDGGCMRKTSPRTQKCR